MEGWQRGRSAGGDFDELNLPESFRSRIADGPAIRNPIQPAVPSLTRLTYYVKTFPPPLASLFFTYGCRTCGRKTKCISRDTVSSLRFFSSGSFTARGHNNATGRMDQHRVEIRGTGPNVHPPVGHVVVRVKPACPTVFVSVVPSPS